jgi:hypothetical protein
MLPQTNASFIVKPDDAEFEWLLCLASAMQACERPAKFSRERQPSPEQDLWNRLQSWLKGRRGGPRIGVL